MAKLSFVHRNPAFHLYDVPRRAQVHYFQSSRYNSFVLVFSLGSQKDAA
jgi:hypothetical protein